MAIYTYFGGMDEVRSEVSREAFARLGEHMAAVAVTDDPVADLGLLGWAYFTNAIENPNLYRVMFMERPPSEAASRTGLATFNRLVAAVARCVDGGAFAPGDPAGYATQLWGLVHGLVTLELAGLLAPGQGLSCMLDTARFLFVGYGMPCEAADRSLADLRSRAPGDGTSAPGAPGPLRPRRREASAN
jgi:AcrR family transcriptional regulator